MEVYFYDTGWFCHVHLQRPQSQGYFCRFAGGNVCPGVDYKNQELLSETYVFFAFVVSFSLCSLLKEEGMCFLGRKVECTSRLQQKWATLSLAVGMVNQEWRTIESYPEKPFQQYKLCKEQKHLYIFCGFMGGCSDLTQLSVLETWLW